MKILTWHIQVGDATYSSIVNFPNTCDATSLIQFVCDLSVTNNLMLLILHYFYGKKSILMKLAVYLIQLNKKVSLLNLLDRNTLC